MAGKRIDPPKLKDGDDYEEWAREIEIWQIVTDVPKDKQGALIYLSLEGQARQCCKSISTDKLKGDGGVTELMKKLEELFAKDSEQAAFTAYEQFETFMRPTEMEMVDFINEWDRRYAKITEKKMELPDGVLAYRLLKSANVSDICQTMVRTSISKLSLDEVKRQLKAVHDKTISSVDSKKAGIKVEPSFTCDSEECDDVYYTYNNRGARGNRSRGRGRGRGRGNSSGQYQRQVADKSQQPERNETTAKGEKQEVGRKKNSVNPPDRTGNVSKCAICHSIMHWASQCPHNDDDECVTLFTSKAIESEYAKDFLSETFNAAVLDSGCSKTVCGEEWFNSYMNSLKKEDVDKIEEKQSASQFRFGNGNAFKSIKKVTVPAKIGSKNIQIETDVIKTDIPMLLSKSSMKTANAKIDFLTDKVEMLGEQIDLKFTSSGHYVIDLHPADLEEIKGNIALFNLTEATAKKIHTQFGHARSERLKKLVTDAGVKDEKFLKLLDDTEDSCETCKRYKKPKPRPAVALALTEEFNGVVSVDLKDVGVDKIFHMIDNATRYSGAALIKNKSKEEIVDQFFINWIKIFGVPKKLLSDNGREFNNELFREMASLLGIELLTTAAESPWSNGITERHNALIAIMMEKILDEAHCSKEIALAWSISAKNSLLNVYGFSPNQLAFGHNPNFPALINSTVATAEDASSSKLIADHLNAMHAARKSFVENESSDKLRRAIERKTRTSTAIVYEQGDKVYYKRKNSQRWQGPGHVIGKDSNQVFVKHGGDYYRVSPIDLQPAESKSKNGNEVIEKICESAEARENQIGKVADQVHDTSSDDSDDCGDDAEVVENTNKVLETGEAEAVIEDNCSNELNPTVLRGEMPKKGSKIRYKLVDENSWNEATVLSRAGKVGSKHQFWSNIRSKDNEDSSLHMKDLEAWEYVNEEVLITSATETHDVAKAKQLELENLKKHEVYEEMPDLGQNKIQTTWIITENVKNGSSQLKARLVAKGFQENSLDVRKDSPTCLKSSLKISFSIAASNNWTVKVLDIKSAFLQGREIERDVYVEPPIEAGQGIVWKLKKTIYGLNDASRKWYLQIKASLEKHGAVMSIYDEALFYFLHNDELCGLICLHVDDFFHCGTKQFNNRVIGGVKSDFEISKEAERSFSYVGLEVSQKSDGLYLSQYSYIEKLEAIKLDTVVDKQAALSDIMKKQLRSLIGQLAWVANQTRPDVAFEVCQLSVNFKNANVGEVVKANKCVKKLKSEEVYLKFTNLGDMKKAKLVSYTDASFNNLGDNGSQGGNVCFLLGENGSHSVLSWQSKKIQRVVKSTLSAETMALMTGVESCFLYAALLREVHNNKLEMNVHGVTDSKSLYDAVHTSKTLEDSRLKIDVAVLRDYLRKKEMKSIAWVETTDQLADPLTKSGASTKKLVDAVRGDVNIIRI